MSNLELSPGSSEFEPSLEKIRALMLLKNKLFRPAYTQWRIDIAIQGLYEEIPKITDQSIKVWQEKERLKAEYQSKGTDPSWKRAWLEYEKYSKEMGVWRTQRMGSYIDRKLSSTRREIYEAEREGIYKKIINSDLHSFIATAPLPPELLKEANNQLVSPSVGDNASMHGENPVVIFDMLTNQVLEGLQAAQNGSRSNGDEYGLRLLYEAGVHFFAGDRLDVAETEYRNFLSTCTDSIDPSDIANDTWVNYKFDSLDIDHIPKWKIRMEKCKSAFDTLVDK